MHRAIWAALFLGVGLASPAQAQHVSSFGNPPRHLHFKPVNTTKNLAAPIAAQESKGFSLTKFFPKLSLPSFSTSPKVGVSSLPPPGSFPSTQSKSPFQPLPPFTPNR